MSYRVEVENSHTASMNIDSYKLAFSYYTAAVTGFVITDDHQTNVKLFKKLKSKFILMNQRFHSPEEKGQCKVCGCTWYNACPNQCHWVKKDLCSNCFGKEKKK